MLQSSWCIRAVLEGLINHYNPRFIHIITPAVEIPKLRNLMEQCGIGNARAHPEETFFPGQSKEVICQELKLEGSLYKPGWFYQQLLKLGASEGIAGLSEWYLVWDSDMLPVEAWPVLRSGPDGPQHVVALVQHRAYGNSKIVAHWHDWIREVLGVDVLTDSEGTFVPHHMWFREAHLRGFRSQVHSFFRSEEHWAVLMMRSANRFKTFSEYWSYASWAAAQHPKELCFHPYSQYGVTNERFFDNGERGLFSQALASFAKSKVETPTYVQLMSFIKSAYGDSPRPSSVNFEQSERHVQKPPETMHLEELRSRWNGRANMST